MDAVVVGGQPAWEALRDSTEPLVSLPTASLRDCSWRVSRREVSTGVAFLVMVERLGTGVASSGSGRGGGGGAAAAKSATANSAGASAGAGAGKNRLATGSNASSSGGGGGGGSGSPGTTVARRMRTRKLRAKRISNSAEARVVSSGGGDFDERTCLSDDEEDVANVRGVANSVSPVGGSRVARGGAQLGLAGGASRRASAPSAKLMPVMRDDQSSSSSIESESLFDHHSNSPPSSVGSPAPRQQARSPARSTQLQRGFSASDAPAMLAFPMARRTTLGALETLHEDELPISGSLGTGSKKKSQEDPESDVESDSESNEGEGGEAGSPLIRTHDVYVRVIALQDHVVTGHSRKLSFRKDEPFTVLASSMSNNEWVGVHKGRKGLFPPAAVMVLGVK
jgi:hypothetical protein